VIEDDKTSGTHMSKKTDIVWGYLFLAFSHFGGRYRGRQCRMIFCSAFLKN